MKPMGPPHASPATGATASAGDRSPRVLLLCDRLDLAGGVERFVCTLAGQLDAVGMSVAVGSVHTPPAEVRYPLPERVRVLHGARPLPVGEGTWALLRKQWRTGRALAALVRAEQPDVLILNGLTTACSVLAVTALTARSVAPRTICCDHNHFDARSKPWRRLRALLYRRVAAVVSLSRADAPRFAAINPRTEVIYNAASLRAEVPEAPDAPTVLAVGRHVAQKGLDLLLTAWARVQAQMPAARLRILGDGPLSAALQTQARALGIDRSVQWLAPTAQVQAQYREAAVFVLSSRYEGMPLALLEAQALGVPAVAFDCPTGPAEIISADTGVVVPPGDTRALADALLHLLADAPLRERMGQAAIARSAAVFSPAQHVRQWTALVRRVAAGAQLAAAA
jgi:glycosyltransferase involved in cell wall biosynthesis